MKKYQQPILFYCDLPPRNLTLQEQEAVIYWLIEHKDWDHSDACGFLEASLVAAFPPDKRFPLRYIDTTIVVINLMTVFKFILLQDGKIEMKDEYKRL